MSKQVGFCTFDSGVHYYNLKSSLSQPQMLVVPDHTDPFLPVPDDLLVNLSESRAVVDTLVENLAQASNLDLATKQTNKKSMLNFEAAGCDLIAGGVDPAEP